MRGPFKCIQLRQQSDPAVIEKQMVLNMKVHWSSTYTMLDCGYDLKEVMIPIIHLQCPSLSDQDVDKFVFEIAMDETGEKRNKLAALQLTEAEWSRVDLFLNLLASTLHLALLALETLYAGWTKCAADPKYSHFAEALEQALEKVDEYYQKTSNSNTCMFAMGKLSRTSFQIPGANRYLVLHPTKKLLYFQKHWPQDLQEKAKQDMEETFKQRYLTLCSASPGVSVPVKKPATSKMRHAVVLDDNNNVTGLAKTHLYPLKLWLDEYKLYLHLHEVVLEGMDTGSRSDQLGVICPVLSATDARNFISPPSKFGTIIQKM
ncbi:hypothetical protein B0H10DRAFT_1966971 [Mycena sp. CBHHK59/15]|nr:hypothetical protein B0H10DRAFT_1966971 [Mycena sp. CBHHK59/15]